MTCSSDLTIKLWDTANEYKNVKTLYGHDHSVSAARFLPSGDFLVSASRDRTIKVWEVATGCAPASLCTPRPSATVFADGTALGFPRRYCTKTLMGHTEWVRSVVPSTDSRLLVSCSNDQVRDLLPAFPFFPPAGS